MTPRASSRAATHCAQLPVASSTRAGQPRVDDVIIDADPAQLGRGGRQQRAGRGVVTAAELRFAAGPGDLGEQQFVADPGGSLGGGGERAVRLREVAPPGQGDGQAVLGVRDAAHVRDLPADLQRGAMRGYRRVPVLACYRDQRVVLEEVRGDRQVPVRFPDAALRRAGPREVRPGGVDVTREIGNRTGQAPETGLIVGRPALVRPGGGERRRFRAQSPGLLVEAEEQVKLGDPEQERRPPGAVGGGCQGPVGQFAGLLEAAPDEGDVRPQQQAVR
jgi:hypothetical protein